MTAGTDGLTLDGMNMERIETIIAKIKDHSYQPNPARRVYIAKKNSKKKRPLGIPSTDDKLIQEVVRMILEAIYEPTFSSKGAGYERWARSFNLKQMAQTLNFLTEHGLLEYGKLKEKTAAATARYNELSGQIKAAEQRLAEIAVLKTHIINYSKTREVYAAYRKAGYSKKFLAEHESEILLHKAAKKAFDDLGVKKLPTVRNLQTEYAALLSEKKAAYGDYRNVRDEMKELLTVKANVDRLMGYEDQEKEQEMQKKQEQSQGR